MKKILLYALLISLFPATTFAVKQKDGNRTGPVSEYVKQHIMPVVSEKRQAFDVLLSATEKNELASIREQLEQLRENHRVAMQARSEESSDVNLTASSEAKNENHAKMKELMEQVHIIAEQHRSQLDEIFNVLAPQQKVWKNDIARIVASKENTEERESSSFSEKDNFHYGMNGRFKMGGRTGFLLMNPSKALTSGNDRMSNTENDLSASSTKTMSMFPNPAANQISLNISGISAENKLIVTDMTGKIVFEKENLLPSETISCNDFNNGIYFVRLSSADSDINQKLIISR